MGKTLFEKVWEKHVILNQDSTTDLIYIDFHLMHEVTSSHAFNTLREMNLKVRRPDLCLATMDHQVPTQGLNNPVADEVSANQMAALEKNCHDFNIELYPWKDNNQGIIHVIGPEMGVTQPGMTIVCGDSHTSTHGAFGALAFGIGISEVTHVIATQSLTQSKPKTLSVKVNGTLNDGVTAKDLILHIIKILGTDGGTGHVIEYRGEAIRNLNIEERMTVCNMSIEAGARAGMIAPDEATFKYLKNRKYSPVGEDWDKAVEAWKKLKSDDDAIFDKEIIIDANDIKESITWGTTPAQVTELDGKVPSPKDENEERALEYMDLKAGTKIKDIDVNFVFIGSCTNSRMEDLKAVAKVVNGKKVKDGVTAIIVPGSMQIKKEAEEMGLAKIFTDAGFEWRAAGCSMCIGMNDDFIPVGTRTASTSNRNFEGRQGKGVKTHLVSPQVAAATAILGKFASPKDL